MTVILLAPAEPRCRPSEPCVVKARCARNLAANAVGHGSGPGPLRDYSSEPGGGTALCPGFYTPAQAREDAGRILADAARARIEAARSKR